MRFGLALLATFLLPIVAFAALININTADETLLDSLPGIGPSKATAIIDYRTQNGPFAKIEDIQNVSGIGPSTFTDIKDLITVGDMAPVPPPTPVPGTTTTATTISGGATYVPPPSSISIAISGSPTALQNVPLHLSARVTTKGSTIDPTAQITWSFGDGSAQTGTLVEKVYRHLGTYLITAHASDGPAEAQDEIIVTVVPTQVQVLTGSSDGIIVQNDSSERLDISGWRILADVGSFRIPNGTSVLPKSSALFPYAITNLPATSDVTLLYADGLVAARSGQLISATVSSAPLSQEVMQPSPLPTRSYSVEAAPPITSVSPNTQDHVNAILAPTAATEIAAVGAALSTDTNIASSTPRSALFLSPWLWGLVAVIVAAGGAFVLI